MAENLPKELRADIEREGWILRTKGWTLTRIAEKFGTTEATVCRTMQRVEKRLAAEFKERAEEIKARQTVQLDYVVNEALREWERSKEDAESESIVSGRASAKDGVVTRLPDQVTKTRAGQTGNPALLAQARGALADQRAIWGAEAPKKEAFTNVDGTETVPLVITEVRVKQPNDSAD